MALVKYSSIHTKSIACVPYRCPSVHTLLRLRVRSSLISVGLCWKRFRLKAEASRSPRAKNKVSGCVVGPSSWLTCGKVTDVWGFLAREAGLPLSFNQECFLRSFLCVSREKKLLWFWGKDFCFIDCSVAVVLLYVSVSHLLSKVILTMLCLWLLLVS